MPNQSKPLSRTIRALVLGFGLFSTQSLFAQAPALLWSTNVGASVFAVDALTNVYAGSNGTVVELNGAGVPLQTNILSQLPGQAQRDSSGNLYFAGVLPAPNYGFGPVYTNPACFMAKYTSAGTLVWSNVFGPSGNLKGIAVSDLQVDSDGNGYAGFTYSVDTLSHVPAVAKFDSSGANIWTMAMPQQTVQNGGGPVESTIGTIRLYIPSPTNGYALAYDYYAGGGLGSWANTLSHFDTNGTATVITNWLVAFPGPTPPPILDSVGNFYSGDGGLTKRNPSGSVIWQNPAFSGWPIGRDFYGGAHVADGSGSLSRADADGNLVWTTNFQSGACQSVLLDASGNRFVSFSGGIIGRLGAEYASAPAITNEIQPPSQTVFVGSNVTFSVGASGFTPLRYYWYFNNAFLSEQASSSLTLSNVTTGQAGSYYVVVSNSISTATSAPVQLRVKQVEFFIGSQLLTNGTYTMATNPTVTVRSAFANGSVFYTLNGSTPSFASTPYSGPFPLYESATLRAIGYSADFSQSEEADQVNAVIVAQHTLTTSTLGGGHITLNPPGGLYPSSTNVTATAVPDSGWSFLYWTGDASGTNPSLDISMHSDQSIHAVFGTTLSTTVQGNGQIVLYPPGGTYSYGQLVRLTAVPNAGSFFGVWGNAASGSTNPLYISVTNANQTVSSIFGTNSGSQVNVYVSVTGRGSVAVNPPANVYTTGQSVTLTATPTPGQTFLNWSGDASGTQNPLGVVLNQSKVITANFSGTTAASVAINSQVGEGMSPDGFRFSLLSDPEAFFEVDCSSNLTTWQSLGFVTNHTGQMQFVDPSAGNWPRKYYRIVP